MWRKGGKEEGKEGREKLILQRWTYESRSTDGHRESPLIRRENLRQCSTSPSENPRHLLSTPDIEIKKLIRPKESSTQGVRDCADVRDYGRSRNKLDLTGGPAPSQT